MKGHHQGLGKGAWTVVVVLWFAAFLNYFDRLLLTSMRTSLVEDIKMTDAQFGLLTSSFLWVYGVFSPIGGFIADRFGRRKVILASVVIWSAVTWLTGQARSLSELMWARALMGIGEACYVPAALALITNHHRGSTRSLATGIHNSGLYMGAALGGLGGYLAELYGWRTTFTLLGAIGVAYGILAAGFVKDAAVDDDQREACAKTPLTGATSSLLANQRYWRLVSAFCMISIANWFAYGWMPTYLQQHFGLNQGAAGVSAMGTLQVASFIGVVAGGLLADRWSTTQGRARLWVAAIGFGITAPALGMAGATQNLSFALTGLFVFGLGRGLFDANCMPALRQIAPERYCATGYGFMNFCGCIVGGLVTYGSGALLDAQIPLQYVFFGVAAGMAFGALLLARLKPE